MRFRWTAYVVALLGMMLLATDVRALPVYARKHQLPCTQCHSAWPLLNQFGRTFKENGYRLDRDPQPASTAAAGQQESGEITLGDRLALARHLPLSFRIQSRPMEHRNNVDPRFRMDVIHEVEFQVSDSAAGDLSYLANIEAADDAGFALELTDMTMGWHPLQGINIVGGFSRLGFVDPYNTFANRRLTQDRPTPNSATFQSNQRIRDATPFVSLYGRQGGLFYSASAGTGRDDLVGADKRDFFLRTAYDLPGGLTFGAFLLEGKRALTGPTRTQDYRRSGFDVQFEQKGFTVNALWYRAKEDLATTLVPQTNDAYFIQALYVTPTSIPVVPLFRFESVESANRTASTHGATMGLIAYLRGNVNMSFEYFTQPKAPVGAFRTNRYTLMVMFTM